MGIPSINPNCATTEKGLDNHYKLAVKYHEQFIDKVPNLAEDRRLVCEKWRVNFDAAHKAIIEEIEEHLLETASSTSGKHDATTEEQMHDVQQQLKSQEQQFLKIDEKRQRGADLCSRGIELTDIDAVIAFYRGADNLQLEHWPQSERHNEENVETDLCVAVIETEPEKHVIDVLVNYHSRLHQLTRVLAWCSRFIANCHAKIKKEKIKSSELSSKEINNALQMCIRRAQDIEFARLCSSI